MRIITFLSLCAIAAFFGVMGVLFITATNPALSYLCIGICAVLCGALIYDIVEQFVNALSSEEDYDDRDYY